MKNATARAREKQSPGKYEFQKSCATVFIKTSNVTVINQARLLKSQVDSFVELLLNNCLSAGCSNGQGFRQCNVIYRFLLNIFYLFRNSNPDVGQFRSQMLWLSRTKLL